METIILEPLLGGPITLFFFVLIKKITICHIFRLLINYLNIHQLLNEIKKIPIEHKVIIIAYYNLLLCYIFLMFMILL